MSFLSDIYQGAKSLLVGTKPQAVIQSPDNLQDYQKRALSEALAQLTTPIKANRQTMTSLAGMEKLAQSFGDGSSPTGNAQGDYALSETLSGRPSLIDSTYKAKVEDPTLRTLNENVLPTIAREFGGGSNLFSSERGAAIDNASRSTMEALIRERAAMAYQAEEDAKNRAVQGLATLGDFKGLNLQTLQALLTGSTTIDQLNLERLKAMLGGATATTKDTVGIGLPGQEGLLQGAAQGFGAALGKKMAG